MPYIKPKEPPFISMVRLVHGHELRGNKLAAVLGCSRTRASDLMKCPEKLTLADLDRLNRYGHIPIEEIREALKP